MDRAVSVPPKITISFRSSLGGTFALSDMSDNDLATLGQEANINENLVDSRDRLKLYVFASSPRVAKALSEMSDDPNVHLSELPNGFKSTVSYSATQFGMLFFNEEVFTHLFSAYFEIPTGFKINYSLFTSLYYSQNTSLFCS